MSIPSSLPPVQTTKTDNAAGDGPADVSSFAAAYEVAQAKVLKKGDKIGINMLDKKDQLRLQKLSTDSQVHFDNFVASLQKSVDIGSILNVEEIKTHMLGEISELEYFQNELGVTPDGSKKLGQ